MGDRANIHVVEERGGDLYFYTHWEGTELPRTLAAALARGRGRWGDEAYLSRIIFCEMVRVDTLSETGFGISTYRGDWNHEDLLVHMGDQTVTDRDGRTYSFADFVQRYAPGLAVVS